MTEMRTLSCVIFCFFICAICPGSPRNPNLPFSLTITIADQSVKLGTQVCVTITLKNNSDHDIAFDRSSVPGEAEFHYSVLLLDNEGKPVPETKYWRILQRKEHETYTENVVSMTIHPNEEAKDDFALNKLFDLNKPGKYTLQVAREIPEALGKGLVKSNVLSLVITK
jgi:hypothetical protein